MTSNPVPVVRSELDRAIVAYPVLSRLRLELRKCRDHYALLLGELEAEAEQARVKCQRVKHAVCKALLEEAGAA